MSVIVNSKSKNNLLFYIGTIAYTKDETKDSEVKILMIVGWVPAIIAITLVIVGTICSCCSRNKSENEVPP